MEGLQRAAAVFIYNIMEGTIWHCCYYCDNETAILKETNFELRKLLNYYSNFHGYKFRIAYTDYPPFFWKGKRDGRPKGAEGVLLDKFSRKHNFRYELVKYYNTPNKGAWQTMIEAVEANYVDWAVGGIAMMLKRGTITDFTRYIKTQGFSILYEVHQNPWTTFENILSVFKWPVWLAIASTVAIICVVANYFSGNFINCSKFARAVLLTIAEQPVSQYQMKLVRMSSVCVIFVIWWLCCLNLTTIYKGQLGSFPIKPSYNEPNRIDELAEKDFCFHVNKEESSALKENFEASLDKVYDKSLTRIENHLEFCNSVLELEQRKLAVIDEEVAMQYKVFKTWKALSAEFRSDLRLVTENFFPFTYHAWSMPMGTPFRLKFSKTIGRMNDYGLIDHWYKSASFYRVPRSNTRTEKKSILFDYHPNPAITHDSREWVGRNSCCSVDRDLRQITVTMGAFWTRLLEFPIKNKPICFYLQKNFTSTGEEKLEKAPQRTDAYDELQNAFIRKLDEIGYKQKNWLANNFPYWNQMTVDNLTNVFRLMASEENGKMDFQHFCWFLESMGDSSSDEFREEKFKRSGEFVNIDEFLLLVYNYHSLNETEDLTGLPKLCFDRAEQIRNVTMLSIGQQLEHGLF